MKHLSIKIWANSEGPAKHGYTPKTEDDTALFRLGPLVIGWELVDE